MTKVDFTNWLHSELDAVFNREQTPEQMMLKAIPMIHEFSSQNNGKPMLGAVVSDIKDNKIMLLEEDLWCVHKYLDDLELLRVDKDGKEYSIVGRIKRLEERYLKQMSELETMYLSGNCS